MRDGEVGEGEGERLRRLRDGGRKIALMPRAFVVAAALAVGVVGCSWPDYTLREQPNLDPDTGTEIDTGTQSEMGVDSALDSASGGDASDAEAGEAGPPPTVRIESPKDGAAVSIGTTKTIS